MAVTLNASTSTGLVQTADTSGVIALQNNGTTALTVNNGNVLIGTTSTDAKLIVSVNGGNVINATQTALGGWCLKSVAFNNNGTFYFNEFVAGSTNVGSITSSTTTTTYATSSDYRLKENIEPMKGALNVVQQLKPCKYTWKVDGSVGQGFIAHELQEIVPDCVIGEKDAVDAEGKPIYQGVDTSFLVATLAAAIQELKSELDATKAEVQALKGVQ